MCIETYRGCIEASTDHVKGDTLFQLPPCKVGEVGEAIDLAQLRVLHVLDLAVPVVPPFLHIPPLAADGHVGRMSALHANHGHLERPAMNRHRGMQCDASSRNSYALCSGHVASLVDVLRYTIRHKN